MKYGSMWPTYAKQWDAMKINASRAKEFETLARFAVTNKARYKAIEAATGVPWYLIAVIHRREGNANFGTYLGNGQSLSKKTTIVPKGRGPFPSFEAGAIDALKIDGLDKVRDWRLEKCLYYCETFNGFGYANRGLPSPYVWGGTSIQKPGKYLRDGPGGWSSTTMDTQPGCAPILKMIAQLDPSVTFTRETNPGASAPELSPHGSTAQPAGGSGARTGTTAAIVVTTVGAAVPASKKPDGGFDLWLLIPILVVGASIALVTWFVWPRKEAQGAST